MPAEKKRCIILSGLPAEPEEMAVISSDDYVIAADAGVKNAVKYGITPDLCIGDWDSGTKPDKIENIITLPCEKDDTDTQYAARIALEKGFREVVIIGCIGGRLDHTIAAVGTLLFLNKAGVNSRLIGGSAAVTAVTNGSRKFRKTDEKCYFSVFAAEGPANQVTINGAKYCVENVSLTESYPIGCSNEITADEAEISVGQGTLLMMYCRKN